MDSNPSATSSGSQTPIHTIVKAQIVFLLSTLTEDNFDRNQHEIRSVGLYAMCAIQVLMCIAM